MKTKIMIKCDIGIDMGEVSGSHSEENLERIRKVCCNEALKRLNKILGESKDGITVGNPQFMITLTDDNF